MIGEDVASLAQASHPLAQERPLVLKHTRRSLEQYHYPGMQAFLSSTES
jgi:hypothetical protein